MSRSLISGVTLLIAALIGVLLLADYARPADFLFYRLAEHNLTYNGIERDLLILNPAFAFILGIVPLEPASIGAILTVVSLGVSGYLLTGRFGWPVPLLVIVAWPLWALYRSPAIIAFTLILVAWAMLDAKQARRAGVVAGIGGLFYPASLIGALLIGTRQDDNRFWWWLMLPLVISGLLAVLYYDDVLLHFEFTSPMPVDWLYYGLFLLVVGSLARQKINTLPALWLFITWGALEIFGQIILNGALTSLTSVPAIVAIAAGLTVLLPRPAITGVLMVGTLLLLIAPPEPTDILQADLAAAETFDLSEVSTLLHDRSDAFVMSLPDFDGAAYRIDGQRTSQLAEFATQDDLRSLLVWLAPDVVLSGLTNVIDQPSLEALGYAMQADSDYRRTTETGTWQPTVDLMVDYGLDLKLTHYQLDQSTLEPDAPLRLGLGWRVINPPGDETMTLNISLLDPLNNPMVTIFSPIPDTIWQVDAPMTYHALRVPPDVMPGAYQVNVTVDYRAGILGQAQIAQMIRPFDIIPDTAPIARFDAIALIAENFTVEDRQLRLEYVWQVQQNLATDYNIFLHLSALDDLQPLRQDDGPPVDGRYPSSTWRQGDIIRDVRQIDLTDLATGAYRINVGFFGPDGTRLGGPEGDFITLSQVTIQPDGTVLLRSFSQGQ